MQKSLSITTACFLLVEVLLGCGRAEAPSGGGNSGGSSSQPVGSAGACGAASATSLTLKGAVFELTAPFICRTPESCGNVAERASPEAHRPTLLVVREATANELLVTVGGDGQAFEGTLVRDGDTWTLEAPLTLDRRDRPGWPDDNTTVLETASIVIARSSDGPVQLTGSGTFTYQYSEDDIIYCVRPRRAG